MTLDLQPYRNRDGSIDLDYYKARAARLRREAIAELTGAVFESAVDWIGRVRHSVNWSGFRVHNVSSHRRRPSAPDSHA